MNGRARFIAVNESWKLCPWADVLYACDGFWWTRQRGVPEFQGLKLCQDASAVAQYRDLHKIDIPEGNSKKIFVEKPGVIGSGGNSGFQTLNIAVQFGAMRILLVGFDMHQANGIHWHGPHAKGLNNPQDSNFIRWRENFLSVAKQIRDLGVEVINCNPDSALTAFPKMMVDEVMERWSL